MSKSHFAAGFCDTGINRQRSIFEIQFMCIVFIFFLEINYEINFVISSAFKILLVVYANKANVYVGYGRFICNNLMNKTERSNLTALYSSQRFDHLSRIKRLNSIKLTKLSPS